MNPTPLFTHVVNAFRTRPGSSHDVAHRFTFASMAAARERATAAGIEVESLAVTQHDEPDAAAAPATAVPVLTRTVLDVARLGKPRPLPLLGDIIAAAAQAAHGEYLIYSNIDIGLQPHFYTTVTQLMGRRGAGLEALVVNRRTVHGDWTDPAQLPQVYRAPGLRHPGYDCFIFRREWAQHMRFAHVCIGAFWFDLLMLANVDHASGQRLVVLPDLHLTFHLGDDLAWEMSGDYFEHNRAESLAAIQKLRHEQRVGRFGGFVDWLEVKLAGKRPRVRRAWLEARQWRARRRCDRIVAEVMRQSPETGLAVHPA